MRAKWKRGVGMERAENEEVGEMLSILTAVAERTILPEDAAQHIPEFGVAFQMEPRALTLAAVSFEARTWHRRIKCGELSSEQATRRASHLIATVRAPVHWAGGLVAEKDLRAEMLEPWMHGHALFATGADVDNWWVTCRLCFCPFGAHSGSQSEFFTLLKPDDDRDDGYEEYEFCPTCVETFQDACGWSRG